MNNFWPAIIFALVIGLVKKSTGLSLQDPIDRTFQDQFLWQPNKYNLESMCGGEKADALSGRNKQMYSMWRNVKRTIRELVREKVTDKELSDLVTNYCRRNEEMEFVSKELVQSVQNCFGNRYHLNEEKKLAAKQAFIDSVCGNVYSSLHWEYIFNAKVPKIMA
ncbi:uncharacterized protein LOC117172380 [Belonocnema kinseyi]|uniref:uncharacterized protein LOC117172380 n=1 Tax=Belonocnema kinseyi TaxID=2817044 RepID=UPI00143D27F4|nr:uncharacterized protein LOC117172380 [Belonocnema kinseyi]